MILTGYSIFYKEYYFSYLGNWKKNIDIVSVIAVVTHSKPSFISACSGRIYEFYYDLHDFYIPKPHGLDQGWNLSKDHPFLISTLLCFCASLLVTPVGYVKIHRSK